MFELYKLIQDIKSELPSTLLTWQYDRLEFLFELVSYGLPDTISREILRAGFSIMFAQVYAESSWLTRIYDIINGGLIKP